MREVMGKLEDELKLLEHEFRVQLPKEIGDAVAMGDLRENAEYHAARERQNFVKARITQLRSRLSSLASLTLDRIPTDKAGLGSRLTLLDLASDEEVTYELVIPEVADLEHGRLSIASPIGRSLAGSAEGDEVTVEIPAGKKRFEVLELRTLHDLKKEKEDGAGS